MASYFSSLPIDIRGDIDLIDLVLRVVDFGRENGAFNFVLARDCSLR